MTKIKIEVTKECIKNGQPMNAVCCPVALALKEKRYKNIIVGYFTIMFTNRAGRNVYARTPQLIKQFIARFDIGKKVKPFKFEISY